MGTFELGPSYKPNGMRFQLSTQIDNLPHRKGFPSPPGKRVKDYSAVSLIFGNRNWISFGQSELDRRSLDAQHLHKFAISLHGMFFFPILHTDRIPVEQMGTFACVGKTPDIPCFGKASEQPASQQPLEIKCKVVGIFSQFPLCPTFRPK